MSDSNFMQGALLALLAFVLIAFVGLAVAGLVFGYRMGTKTIEGFMAGLREIREGMGSMGTNLSAQIQQTTGEIAIKIDNSTEILRREEQHTRHNLNNFRAAMQTGGMAPEVDQEDDAAATSLPLISPTGMDPTGTRG